MSLKKSFVIFAVFTFIACFWTLLPAGANLLLNGSFETPVVDPSSHCGMYANCHGFHTDPTYGPSDTMIGNWVVIGTSDISCSGGKCVPNGAPAPVMLMTNDYQETIGGVAGAPPLFFHVEDGNQAVDLTGEGNQGNNGTTNFQNGIKQTVNLTAGQYQLSFWLGHQDSSAPGYTNGPSLISLWIDGSEIQTFANNSNTPDDVTWKQFIYNFNATGPTTIAFIDETPLNNNYAGLDNVNLTKTVPEPASFALLASGIAGLLSLRKRLR